MRIEFKQLKLLYSEMKGKIEDNRKRDNEHGIK